MNPILPRDVFIPDGEPHVMPDGRLYLYGSLDVSGARDYGSNRYRVFSTDDPKLENWVDHGESFRLSDGLLYAPDCAHKDGKYYLYYCTAGNGEYTAVSDAPCGPFTAPRPVNVACGDSIDPAVLVDDDGQAYYFWGQFGLRGARLNPDMRSLDESTVTRNILTEEEHGFHEGSSIRKINGKYYLIFTDITRGRATCLSYAVSDKPLGPYTKGGVIVDCTFCDPQSWNNHGSIEQFHGQWYIFYHRSSQNGKFSRRACCEKIEVLPDGSIPEVRMTSQGGSDPLPAREVIDASRACRVINGAYIAPENGCGEALFVPGSGAFWSAWAEYKFVDFGSGVRRMAIRAKGHGKITARIEGREAICSLAIDSDAYVDWEAETKAVSGAHALYLVFEGENFAVDEFHFA